MRIGSSIALIVIGAIVAFAVDFQVAGVDLRLIGYILMAAGVVPAHHQPRGRLRRTPDHHHDALRRRPGLGRADHPAGPPRRHLLSPERQTARAATVPPSLSVIRRLASVVCRAV